MTHGGRKEFAKGASRERPQDRYDEMYLRRVKANQFDDTLEERVRRPRKVRESENE